jgi:glutamate dehydrogenase/leucine dehydrogenase
VRSLQHEGVLGHRPHHPGRVIAVDDDAVDLLVVAALDGTLQAARAVHLAVNVVAEAAPNSRDVNRRGLKMKLREVVVRFLTNG